LNKIKLELTFWTLVDFKGCTVHLKQGVKQVVSFSCGHNVLCGTCCVLGYSCGGGRLVFKYLLMLL